MSTFLSGILNVISTDLFMNMVTLVVSVGNIFIAYRVYQFTKKDINPKLYVESKILGHENKIRQYSRFGMLNEDLMGIDFNRKGFPEIEHDSLLWQLEIVNNGDLPATNIVVDYSIIIKKKVFDYGQDELDIINERYVDFKTLNRTIKYDYIPPGTRKMNSLMYLKGEFPSADLKINSIYSSELKFIDDSFLLDTYEHPDFNRLQDSNHARKMLGMHSKE